MNKSIITSNFKLRVIQSLQESLSDSENRLYFFYARPFVIPSDEDGEIEMPVQSTGYETKLKSNIIALKRVDTSDLALGIKKYVWTEGTIYTAYNDEISLDGLQYYVVSNNRVFLCLDNNGGSASIDDPAVEDSGDTFIRTSDKYVWKEMYKIPLHYARKFNLPDFMPIVPDVDVIDSAIPGTINRIEVSLKNLTEAEQQTQTHFAPRVAYSTQRLDYIPLFIHGTGDMTELSSVQISAVNGAVQVFSSIWNHLNTGQLIDDGKYLMFWIRPPSGIAVEEQAYCIGKLGEDLQIDPSSLIIVNRGRGYTSDAMCTLVQSSCIGYIEYDGTVISRVEVTHPGKNFTIADVVPAVPPEVLSKFTFHPVLSPPAGYGYSVENDLKSSTLLANVRIAYEEADNAFSVQNNFRSVGLIDSVQQKTTNGVIPATSLTLTAMTTLYVNAVGNIALDDIVFSANGAVGRVVDVYSDHIRVIQNVEDSNTIPFESGFTLFVGGSSGHQTVITSIKEATYVPFSGSILYIDNRHPIERDPEQIEAINFVLTI